MRTVVAILCFLLVLSAGTTGCGSSEQSDSGETVTIEGYEVSLDEVEEYMRQNRGMTREQVEERIRDGIEWRKEQEAQAVQ